MSSILYIYKESKDTFIFHNPNLNTTLQYNHITNTLSEAKDIKTTTIPIKCRSIIGSIETIKNTYLILCTKASPIATLLSSSIFKIDSFSYIPFDNDTTHPDDTKYLSMLDSFLQRNPLYFSDTLNIAIPFYSYNTNTITNNILSNIKNYSHFCWNFFLIKNFISIPNGDILLSSFMFPIINGFVSKIPLDAYKEKAYCILIARKDHRRSGMRFLIRGSDYNGNVANYVESEQLVIIPQRNEMNNNNDFHIYSYIQSRGSIPFLWTQEPNLEFNPQITPSNNHNKNYEVFELHLNDLISKYNNITLINLIDKKKDQKQLGDIYFSLYGDFKTNNINANVNYKWFDFNSECRKMKYENLSQLINESYIKEAIMSYSHSHFKLNEKDLNRCVSHNNANAVISLECNLSNRITVISKQKGIFRTNCIDCLDRTNVCQSVLARKSLHRILFESTLSEDEQNENAFPRFKEVIENQFNMLWGDHGDSLSLAYSGTPALKSDFVRTGMRTTCGIIYDGFLSCKRLYINNIVDGYNQDCHDYFLGIIQPKKHQFKQHSNIIAKMFVPLTTILAYWFYSFNVHHTCPYRKVGENISRSIYRGIVFVGSFLITFSGMLCVFKKNMIDVHTKHK